MSDENNTNTHNVPREAWEMKQPSAIVSASSFGSSEVHPEAETEAKPLGAAIAANFAGFRRMSLPQSVQDAFMWIREGGEVKRDRRSITGLAVHAGIGVSLIAIPMFIVWIFSLAGSRSASFVVSKAASWGIFDLPMDLARCSVIVGYGWLAGIVALIAINFFIKALKLTVRNDQTYQRSMLMFAEILPILRPYLVLFIAALMVHVCASSFYGHDAVSELFKEVNLKEEKETAVPGESLAVAATEALRGVVDTASIFNFRRFILAFFAFVNVASFFLLVEKAFVQVLAFHFRGRTAADRYRDNSFAIKALLRLYKSHLSGEDEVTQQTIKVFDPVRTDKLYAALLGVELVAVPENATLRMEAFFGDLEKLQARRFFNLLDVAENGDLTREEFSVAIQAVINEKDTLINLMNDHDCIIGKIDEILMTVVWAADIVFGMNFLGVPMIKLVAAVCTLLMASVFLFKKIMSEAFNALVFILVTHPFDSGDRVEIGGHVYVVEEVGLWTTTMHAESGTKTIFTNYHLSDHKVANFRRTPRESEVFKLKVSPDTATPENVEALRAELLGYLQKFPRFYLPRLAIESVEIMDSDRAKIDIKIFHRQNFQNEDAKNFRSQRFCFFLKDALEKTGIALSAPLPKAVLSE